MDRQQQQQHQQQQQQYQHQTAIDVETQEIRQARHRASVKWLLSKAFNNRIPDNLKEPYYRDHENQEHLKPQIVVGLGNATLYCQTLSNLYSDPNYQSLNHWSILQTLARKGVPVNESPDMPLTETVLIQTNPLRINAHMSVIEALMILYAKEISSGDRIPNAIRRISGTNTTLIGQNYESSLLSWVSHACAALKRRIDQEIENGATDENGVRIQSPDIPPVRDYQDLCDGVCLALLISYYCPKVVPWNSVRINYLPAVEDSIHNVSIVSNFSQKFLPYSVFHMTPEDITYMRGSMKHNLVVLLADLFNLFEIHPAKCVCYPGMDSQVTRSPSAVSVRRNTPPKDYQIFDHGNMNAADEGFIVHKSRGVTTLSSMQEPLVPARLRQAKEKNNMETKADERGDSLPAGRPSNWEETKKQSFSGRRSRRNSSSEESQLTIENFGGSQDQLNMIGRIERERDRERKLSSASIEPAVAIRSSIADARGTLQIGYDTDSGSEKQDRETEKHVMRRQNSMDNVSLRNIIHSKEKDYTDGDITQQQQQQIKPTSAYIQQDDDTPKRKTSFATLPNTTTWQQQSNLLNQIDQPEIFNTTDDDRPLVDATKLSTIRMKLEEKRRHIEQEKRKMEIAMSRHQEKVGKAAFLQAINKDEEPIQYHDIMINKWGEPQQNATADMMKRTPEVDQIDLEKYQQSIAIMNSNLQDIQQDIHRLATQQNQIQAQHLQAQQLMQAQQIANMLNQQYGSQHNLPSQYRPLPQNFGSSPHIPQTYGSPSAYNSRPPSRDPYQQSMQYINEHGQYINQSPSQTLPPCSSSGVGVGVGGGVVGQSPYPNSHNNPQSMYQQRDNNQYMGENGIYPYTTANQYPGDQYQSNQFMNRPQQQQQQQHQHQQQQQTLPSQTSHEYDDYRSVRDHNSPQPGQFYLHESSPQPIQRRTWAQSAAQNAEIQQQQQQQQQMQQQQHQPQQIQLDINAWQSQNVSSKIDTRTWKSPGGSSSSGSMSGFMLHQNGGSDYGHQEKSYQNLFPVHSSPQHSRTPSRQASNVMSNHRDNRVPIVPPAEDMAPQSISFIGDDDDSVDQIEMNIETIPSRRPELQQIRSQIAPEEMNDADINLGKLNISSGSRTYRIPSPSRPSLNSNSFQDPQEEFSNEKGFYISFDDQPKRPKPPLRAKRASPKKERSVDSLDKREQISQLQKELENDVVKQEQKRNSVISMNNNSENKTNTFRIDGGSPLRSKHHYSDTQSNLNISNQSTTNNIDRRHLEDVTNQQQQQQQQQLHLQQQQNSNGSSKNIDSSKESKALIIGTELSNLDPNSIDEMERKKEKIMLLSLQRRQQQEEAKARKEIEAMQRREKEREKEEERARKKEEQAARRAAILEAHKLKKAMEDAEREGKVLDKAELNMLKHHNVMQSTPRLRTQKVTRPRPKTIHVESGSVDLSEATSLSSRGKKGSNTNLAGYGHLSSNSMRRDYYRGSQDSLAIRESPDEYPSTSSTPIGRRGSYKNSREPTIERGRTLSRISIAKGSTLNFRGRKSNSLMNLCDSGLGRATPPRRAPSPGMGPTSTTNASGRHLPSPSGPGSLPPGLMSKRRIFDDGSSDISSTPSSMMEYSGPKLYKQPAAKSNRGIILNAVEYCVFPGAVNRDAKQKVLEKIARSEAKHFLILFRDAGCQFRALYSYWPENETVVKLYGTGPSQVDEVMFDKFFKYNSGGKCFSQVHTKHLTVTIDAFTIHNSLWQGKKVNLPSKKDMALVI